MSKKHNHPKSTYEQTSKKRKYSIGEIAFNILTLIWFIGLGVMLIIAACLLGKAANEETKERQDISNFYCVDENTGVVYIRSDEGITPAVKADGTPLLKEEIGREREE